MGDYRVVCVHKTSRTRRIRHEHITVIGVGADDADPEAELSVAEVYEAMAAGDRFFVRDPLSGDVEWLRPQHCCGMHMLTSSPRQATVIDLTACDSNVPIPGPPTREADASGFGDLAWLERGQVAISARCRRTQRSHAGPL